MRTATTMALHSMTPTAMRCNDFIVLEDIYGGIGKAHPTQNPQPCLPNPLTTSPVTTSPTPRGVRCTSSILRDTRHPKATPKRTPKPRRPSLFRLSAVHRRLVLRRVGAFSKNVRPSPFLVFGFWLMFLPSVSRPFQKKHHDPGPTTLGEGEAKALVYDTGALSRYPDVGPAHTGVVLPVQSTLKGNPARHQRRHSPLAYDCTFMPFLGGHCASNDHAQHLRRGTRVNEPLQQYP